MAARQWPEPASAAEAAAPIAGISVVVPTLGRPSLLNLLRGLTIGLPAPVPVELVLVDDRAVPAPPLPVPPRLAPLTRVISGHAAGPAAARNTGWRAARYGWVAFLDDDVRPAPDWWRRLAADLTVPQWVGGIQGRLRVPLPADRRPTDWERNTAGLAGSDWITADMAYRWSALATVGGFDERFTRAYREDAELAYRVTQAGWQLARGSRQTSHPVRPESRWVSVRAQRGNADDALLRRLYGRRWRRRLNIPVGRRPAHVATTAAGAAAVIFVVFAAAARRRSWPATAAAAAGAGWLLGTGELALARIRPGPRDPAELASMLASSAVIPPLATLHWLRGWWRHRRTPPARFASDTIGNHFSRAWHVVRRGPV